MLRIETDVSKLTITPTAGALAIAPREEKSLAMPIGYLTLLQRNATSHADRHGHSCPSATAIQQSGGADLTGRPPPLATNS